ncbi:MAG: glycosyltransferase [Thermoanaerobaculia bacterium]
MPRVSVILPVFRPDPAQFAAAIESIVSQTFRDFELVIVEAEPSSETRAVTEQRADPRIRWIHFESPASVAAQHNQAISIARAPLIARADADDICEPRRLEREVAFLDENPDVDVVGSNLTIIDEHGAVVGRRIYPGDHVSIVAAMKRYNPIANSSVMFRRKVVDRFGGWDTTSSLPARDYDWYSRLAHERVRFANLQEPLVRYRIHPASMKSTRLEATLRATLEIKHRYWAEGFGLVDRAVYMLEHMLLLLPASWVLRLFMAIRYRKSGQRQRTPAESS